MIIGATINSPTRTNGSIWVADLTDCGTVESVFVALEAETRSGDGSITEVLLESHEPASDVTLKRTDRRELVQFKWRKFLNAIRSLPSREYVEVQATVLFSKDL